MELNNSSYHTLKAMETDAGLPSGQDVDSSAVRAKQNAQDQKGASASKRDINEEIATKLDLHESPEFKEFLNLIYNSLKDNSEQTNTNISLGTLSTLLKSTEALAQKHSFTDLHKNLNEHHHEINKTQELNEALDLNHNFKERNIKNSLVEFLETLFTHESKLSPSEVKSEEQVAPHKEKEYKNKFFGGLFKAIKPFVNTISENTVKVSLAGAMSHAADAFAKISELSSSLPSVPKSLEKPVGKISLWWSKAINPLGNILQGFESLAKNNLVDALARFSLLFKLGVKEPANLGVPVGTFLDHKMTIMSAENTGYVQKAKKEFNSLGESISYHMDFYKGILKDYWEKFKKGENPLENLALLYAVPALGVSSLLGTFMLRGDVNTPKAQVLGFFRNTSGGIWDIVFNKQRIEKINKLAQEATGNKASLKDLMKDHQVRFMTLYLMNSILDLTMRWWKNPVFTIIQSQISNSIYEVANGLSGKEENPNDMVAHFEKLINKDETKNNIVDFKRIKELGSAIAANFSKENNKSPALA